MALILRGNEVEVCSKQVGFVGSYYAATVINNYGNQSYAMHYKNLVSEDVNLNHSLRLSPPTRSGPCHIRFRLLSFLYMIGLMLMIMMAGGLARFLGSKTPITTYYVFFDTYGVEILYPLSRLRPHRETNGMWVTKKRV